MVTHCSPKTPDETEHDPLVGIERGEFDRVVLEVEDFDSFQSVTTHKGIVVVDEIGGGGRRSFFWFGIREKQQGNDQGNS